MSALHYLNFQAGLAEAEEGWQQMHALRRLLPCLRYGIKEIADDVKTINIMTMTAPCVSVRCIMSRERVLKATFAGIPIFESSEEGFIKRMGKGLQHGK